MAEGGAAGPLEGGGAPPVAAQGPSAFMQELQEIHGPSVKLQRKVKRVPLDLERLYRIVQDKGGYSCSEGKYGFWAAVAEAYFQTHAGRYLGGRMKGHYMDLLKDFEDSERDKKAILDGLDGQDDGDDDDEPDNQGVEAGAVPSYVIQERYMNRLAARQAFLSMLIAEGKLTDFYGELDQLMRAGNGVIEAFRVRNYYSIAFVGRNNLGKSTIIQILLLLGTVSQDQYEDFARVDDEGLEAFPLVKEWVEKERRRRLEGQQHGGGAAGAQAVAALGDGEEEDDDGALPAVQPQPNDYFFVSAPGTVRDGLMRNAAAREAEERGQLKYLKYCEGGAANMDLASFPQFVLPRPRTDDATTSHCIKFRYSNIFHAAVIYYTVEEVRQLLEKYPWPKTPGEEKLLGEDEKRELKFMQLLLQTVESGGKEPSAAASSAAEAEGGEGERAVGQARKRAIAQLRAKAAKAPRTMPKHPGDVKVHPDTEAFLNNPYKLFVGRGKYALDDRVYIRTELEQQLNGPFRALIKDVCVFAPCLLLEGKIELVDTPGLNDCDPLRARNINKQLRCSDHIVAFAERSLGAEECTLRALDEQQIFDRLFHDSLRPGRGELRMSVLLLPERLQQLSGEEICRPNVWDQKKEEQQGIITAALGTLWERLQAAAEMRFGANEEDDLGERVQAQLDKIEVLSVYPMLYLSAMLNVSYMWVRPGARNELLAHTGGADLVALLGNPMQEQHLNSMRGLRDSAQRQQDLLEQRRGHALPGPVCRYAASLYGRGEIVVRENRLAAIVGAIEGGARFRSAAALFTPGSPASVIAEALGGALADGVEAASGWLLQQLQAKIEGKADRLAARTLRGYLRRQDCTTALLQIILEHQPQSVEGVKGRKRALSEQIEAARDGLLAGFKHELEQHLIQTFVTIINPNSPDGELLRGRVDYFIRAMASDELNKHVLQLFEPFMGKGLDASIKEMMEELVNSLVDAAAQHRNPQDILAAVATKMNKIATDVADVARNFRIYWTDAFLQAKTTLIGLGARRKPLVKALFLGFMRGTANNHVLGGRRLRVLIKTINYYGLKCEEDVEALEDEYARRQQGLHVQLKLSHAVFFFMSRNTALGGQNGLARLGRELTQARGGTATACLYKNGLVLRTADELQQLLSQHQQPPIDTWGRAETLEGPGVSRVPIMVHGEPLNGHARRSDLLLSLAAQVLVTKKLPAEKEALADAQQGILVLNEITRFRAGQQQAQAVPDLINIEARVNVLQILKSFASLHRTYVDVFHLHEECAWPRVVDIYRIVPDPAPPQQAAARRARSYKICWSPRKGFGPASMDARVRIGTPPQTPRDLVASSHRGSPASSRPGSPAGGAFGSRDVLNIGGPDPPNDRGRSRSRSRSNGSRRSHSSKGGGGGKTSRSGKAPAKRGGAAGGEPASKHARVTEGRSSAGSSSSFSSGRSAKAASTSSSSSRAGDRGAGAAASSASASASARPPVEDFKIPKKYGREPRK